MANCCDLAGRHITFVLDTLDLGGAERQALLLARYLKDIEGARVEVVGLTGEPGYAAELCDRYGIPWRIIDFTLMCRRYWWPLQFARAARRLRKNRPDVLMPYTTQPNLLCGILWRKIGAKTCIWNQRDAGTENGVWELPLKAVRRTPWFISNSRPGADFLTDKMGADRERVSVVYNGVELAPPETDRDAWRKTLGIDANCFAACMVANLTANKDHRTLISAWREVASATERRGKTAALLLPGKQYGVEVELRALADDLGISHCVHFLGMVKDISGLLGASDIAVFSSVAEGCPNGIIESMASGLAVAATDIPAIRDVVGPDGYDLLAPPGDSQKLAEKILVLGESPELRAERGTKNKERAERQFSPDAMCANMTHVISRAMEATRC